METSHMDISEIWPPFALHLRSDGMELSPVQEADIPELAQIARGGVRRDGIEAFPYCYLAGAQQPRARLRGPRQVAISTDNTPRS
ncbi:hypothetical protein BLIN9172_02582 [Brevibacterium linens ATCC 9172]|uniref:Uncharacterized protein n=1 Tax=Brevibacterium linens ATCC 9172 TaxID=1255617 RepID=A0A2H1JWM2_BRELN|nr:hypothetical protein BLIN9172_02582 [Brevibacterium linens ATCC 9172]